MGGEEQYRSYNTYDKRLVSYAKCQGRTDPIEITIAGFC